MSIPNFGFTFSFRLKGIASSLFFTWNIYGNGIIRTFWVHFFGCPYHSSGTIMHLDTGLKRLVRVVTEPIKFVFGVEKWLIESNVTVTKLHLHLDQYYAEFITIFIKMVFVNATNLFFSCFRWRSHDKPSTVGHASWQPVYRK